MEIPSPAAGVVKELRVKTATRFTGKSCPQSLKRQKSPAAQQSPPRNPKRGKARPVGSRGGQMFLRAPTPRAAGLACRSLQASLGGGPLAASWDFGAGFAAPPGIFCLFKDEDRTVPVKPCRGLDP